MSCIHYKFKSSLDYDTITFEDLHVSLKDLRDAICKAKKIGQSNDHKLEIVNAQTKKKYEDEQEMISRNTSVIVQRVPIASRQSNRTTSDKQKLQIFPQSESSKLLSAEELMQNKMTDLATANATEEEKLKVMMSQSSEGFDPTKYPTKPVGNKQAGVTGHIRVPPPSYVCFRCGQRGHWLRFCPTQGDSRYDNLPVKPIAGVPSSQLVTLDHHVPGAMIDRHGNYVMRSVDYEAMLKKSKPSAPIKEIMPVPDELKCSMCSELMKDAVIIQCCGESFCDDCIREYLLEHDFTCPKCSETDVSPDTLMANKALRTAVKNHQNINSEHRTVSQKVSDIVPTTALAVAAVQQAEKKQTSVTIATTAALSRATVTMTTAAYVTSTTPSTSVTMTTASNKKAALQLVSQLEQNILIKQAASSAAQEIITSDVLTAESSASYDSSAAHVSRSVSPTPPKQQQQPSVVTQSESTTRQTSASTVISQPIITQATAQPTTSAVMTYSTNTAVAAYKPALLPTPAAMTAPTAGASQLDPFAVAAAAALLLASGTSTTGSTASTAPDPASLLAADQLLQQELNSRSRSPAPLSAEEFYRQQNRLKNKSKRKHSSSTSSSPSRTTHKRKHHHHSTKSERKKHKEHKSREEKSSHKHKRKKHHKERLQDSPNEGEIPDSEFKMPHTRSAVTVVKRPTDPKVSLLAPDLESPVLPPCVQNFTETAELSTMDITSCEQEMVGKDKGMMKSELLTDIKPTTNVTDSVINTIKNATTSSESPEEDGIEEGEILEGTGTHTTTSSNNPPLRDGKTVRKLKRKPSQSIELSADKLSSHKMKKRKWKKEKDNSGEKKKHKFR